MADFATFALCYGFFEPNDLLCCEQAFRCSDINQDGTVNLRDFATFAFWFAQSTTLLTPDCVP